MSTDPLRNPVSPGQPATLAAVDAFVMAYLDFTPAMGDVLAAADADPEHALVNAYAAALMLFGETTGAAEAAEPYLARAEAAPANGRERALVAALGAWADDDAPRAMALHEAAVRQWPRDLIAVKLHHAHGLTTGAFPDMLRVALVALEHSPDLAWAHGLAAFAYEECGLLDDAEAAAERALAMLRSEPWAHHAMLHVHHERGRAEAGLTFAREVADTWGRLNSFSSHLWWHVGLFQLARGDGAGALATWDRHVWDVAPELPQDQINAVSLLARIEWAGWDAGGRWAAMRPYLARRAADAASPFLATQYLYGLARAGAAEADALMAAIRARAAAAPAHARRAWVEAAVPAAEGLLALARGDHAAAAARLDAAAPALLAAGGSAAQRDLYEQARLHALIGAGELARAQACLEARRRRDPDDVPVSRALAEVYGRLGLPALAARAAANANRLQSGAG